MNGNHPDQLVKVVTGYHKCTEVPPEARANGLLNRFAVVLGTYRHGCPWMYFDWRLFSNLVKRLLEPLGCDSVAISLEDQQTLASLDELAKKIASLPEEDQLPPTHVRAMKDENLLCLVETEFWTRVGGPEPYHDSYTVSFYTRASHAAQFTQICRSVCTELGATISSMEVADTLTPPADDQWGRKGGPLRHLFACLARVVTGNRGQ